MGNGFILVIKSSLAHEIYILLVKSQDVRNV